MASGMQYHALRPSGRPGSAENDHPVSSEQKAHPQAGHGFPDSRYAWYVVLVLFLAYVVSFLDRQILTLLVEPIKADLELSDTMVSLLHGFTFAIFYTLFGLPLGWVILGTGTWDKTSSINSPLLSFEISQSGFGMYVKYLMAGFLVVFAVSMTIQFMSYFLSSVAVINNETAAGEAQQA